MGFEARSRYHGVMVLVSAKAILKQLTPACASALEQAVGWCVESRHYEVTVEHVMLALLDQGAPDVAVITSSLSLDGDALQGILKQALRVLRTGNTGRPTFSPVMLEWMQDAALVGTLEHAEPRIRSGILFALLVKSWARYTTAPLGAVLDTVNKDALGASLPSLLARSQEIAGSPPAAAPAAAPSAVARFCVDLTAEAQARRLDPVVEREREVREMLVVLGRRRHASPLVVGEPGVGKTALVEAVAALSAGERPPPALRGAKIVRLDPGQLQAGASMKGELESRMLQLLREVKTAPVILFLDGPGALVGEWAHIVRSALSAGEARVILTATPAEHEALVARDAGLAACFRPVALREPDAQAAAAMLLALRPRLEEAHGVRIPDDAVHASVELARKHLPGRRLPGVAVDLLDEAGSLAALGRRDGAAAPHVDRGVVAEVVATWTGGA